jgi:hypothetical protein
MKTILVFFILQFGNILSSFEIVYEVKLENVKEIDYKRFEENFHQGYRIVTNIDMGSKNIFLFLPTKGILPQNKTDNQINISSNDDKRISKLVVFNKNGEFVTYIGKHGNRGKEGFLHLTDVNVIGSEIQLSGDKFIVYNKNNFDFEYYIDSTCPDTNIKLTMKHCKGNIGYGEQPIGFLSDHFNSAFTCTLINDSEYDDVKMISNVSPFFDVQLYKDLVFNNHVQYNEIKGSNMVKSYVGIVWTRGVYVGSHYSLLSDNSFIIINRFATDIKFYGKDKNLPDSIYLEDIAKLREEEISSFVDTFTRSSDVKYFTQLENFFYNENNQLAFLYFRASDITEKLYSSSRLFFIYSVKTRNPILSLTPIDFYPIAYDEVDELIVGLVVSNNSVFIRFYKL